MKGIKGGRNTLLRLPDTLRSSRNSLSPGYEGKYRIQSDLNNFIVIDNEDNILLKVYTRDEKDNRVNYIEGHFFDKRGKLAARGDERCLHINCPLRM